MQRHVAETLSKSCATFCFTIFPSQCFISTAKSFEIYITRNKDRSVRYITSVCVCVCAQVGICSMPQVWTGQSFSHTHPAMGNTVKLLSLFFMLQRILPVPLHTHIASGQVKLRLASLTPALLKKKKKKKWCSFTPHEFFFLTHQSSTQHSLTGNNMRMRRVNLTEIFSCHFSLYWVELTHYFLYR